jgi:hypothetical protein
VTVAGCIPVHRPPVPRRRRLHRAIAAALAGSGTDSGADARARAWHLGLGAEGPDAGIAEVLDAAAAAARSAAAPEGAAGLAELARKLTPAGRDRDRIRRTLDLAQYLFEAGDTTGARSELEALVAEMTPGPDRARVLLRLADVRYWAESQPAGAACARQAVAEAAPDSLPLAEAHALVAQLAARTCSCPAPDPANRRNASTRRVRHRDRPPRGLLVIGAHQSRCHTVKCHTDANVARRLVLRRPGHAAMERTRCPRRRGQRR